MMADLDVNVIRAEADDRERRILIEDQLEWIKFFTDHLEVKAAGMPPINIVYSEGDLRTGDNVRVKGPTRTFSDWRNDPWLA